MGMLQEFKEFAVKGNVVDMAVGVVIGGAFGKIVTSLVNDIVMPLVGKAIGGVDFKDLYLNLSGGEYASLAAAKEAGAATVAYGLFINSIIDFTIIAACIFLAVKAINQLKRKKAEAAPDPTTKNCAECCMEIPIAAKRCGHCTAMVA